MDDRITLSTESVSPLYVEMICNQYPEAQDALMRLVTMGTFRVQGGFTLSTEAIDSMAHTQLAEPLTSLLTLASSLFQLNKCINDVTEQRMILNDLAVQNKVNLIQQGIIDVKAYKLTIDEALSLHESQLNDFHKTIDAIHRWIDENYHSYIDYEAQLVKELLAILKRPMSEKQALRIVEKKQPGAENKGKLVEKKLKQYEQWRQQMLGIFKLETIDRRIALAQALITKKHPAQTKKSSQPLWHDLRALGVTHKLKTTFKSSEWKPPTQKRKSPMKAIQRELNKAISLIGDAMRDIEERKRVAILDQKIKEADAAA